MKLTIAFAFIFIMVTIKSLATIIHVPLDYQTIQAAIIASNNSDTVLVEPGTYYENINFRGKNIVLTSRFYVSLDTSFICSTIINGSQPLYPDTASCIIFNSFEDSTAVIQGFTITGGAGTKWLDVHGAGAFREGGGIITEFSSPVIRYNHIVNNIVTNATGVVSTGGGGLRCGDSEPKIYNNVIAYNQGRYGGGVVFNYCPSALLKNNLIVHNSGGQSFGGGGVWATGSSTSNIIDVENNTIADNHISGTGAYGGKGGGIFVFSVTLNSKNNVIWGNTQIGNSIVAYQGGIVNTTYSDVDFSVAGNGNINSDPLFEDSVLFLLLPLSPCIDKGDSDIVFNDLVSSPGSALYPSHGTERNDMGSYGGPNAKLFPSCNLGLAGISEHVNVTGLNVYPNPSSDVINIHSPGEKIIRIELYNLPGEKVGWKNYSDYDIPFPVNDLTPGLYFIHLIYQNKIIVNKVQVIK